MTGIGTVEVTVGGGIVTLEDVLHVPNLDGNLLSIGAARKHGITVEFGLKNVLFKHNGTVVCTAMQHGSIYVVKSTNGKTAFQVQAYGKPANGLAAPAITGGGPSTSEPIPQLVGAAPEHGGGSNEAPSDEEDLGHNTPEFPDLAPQAQTNYWKWH